MSFKDVTELKAYMKWSSEQPPRISAHRGGPMSGFPENAIETFENILTYAPCLIECDVRLTKDGKLVLMHDRTLERTTTGKGLVKDFSLAELKKLFLKDATGQVTAYRIPEFSRVLDWAKGKAVLTLDVKDDTGFARVIRAVRAKKAEACVIIISYNIEELKTINSLAPDLMVSASASGVEGVKRLLYTGIPPENICVFVGVYEPDHRVYELLHQNGICAILGTIHNLDKKAETRGVKVYQNLYNNGADILATDNVLLVIKAISGGKKDL